MNLHLTRVKTSQFDFEFIYLISHPDSNSVIRTKSKYLTYKKKGTTHSIDLDQETNKKVRQIVETNQRFFIVIFLAADKR